jgi:hypothetical protein
MADPNNLKIKITAVDLTKRVFRGLSKSLSFAKNALLSFRTSLIAAAGLGGLGLLVKSSLQSIDVLGKTASKIGVTTQELQKLRFAADLAGVQTRTVDMALQRFTRRLSEAANDTGEAKDALKELGITAKSFQELPLEQQMIKLSDAFEGVDSQSERVRLAFKLFDSEGVAMVNVLQQGSEALREMFNEAESLGMILSTGSVRGVEQANDAFTKLKAIFKGLTDSLTAALAPALTEMADSLSSSLKKMLEEAGGAEELGRAIVVTIIDFTEKASLAVINFVKRLSRGIANLFGIFAEFSDTAKRAEASLRRIEELGVGMFFQHLRDQVASGSSALEDFNRNLGGSNDGANQGITALQEYANAAKEAKVDLQSMAVDGLRSVEDALIGVVMKTESAKDAFKAMAASIIKDLIRIHIQRTITGPIANSLSTLLPKPQAMGGHVAANRPYMVGERGPELFVPGASGTIIPNNKMGGNGAVVNQTINVSTGVSQTVRAEIAQMMPQIRDQTKAAVLDARRRGGSFASAF